MKQNTLCMGLLALMLLLFGGVLDSAHAQRMPPGSYLQSCRDVRIVHGRDLAANCKTSRGDLRSSQLADFNSCRGDISNQNGQLFCERRGGGGGGGWAPGPGQRPGAGPVPGSGNGPQGSYRQSCGNIDRRGNVLNAMCRDRGGRWVQSRLDLLACAPNGDIRNNNGQLACPPIPPPPGSYLQTCRNARVAGMWLAADCRTMNGGWRDARLNLATCRVPPNIINANGQLVCR